MRPPQSLPLLLTLLLLLSLTQCLKFTSNYNPQLISTRKLKSTQPLTLPTILTRRSIYTPLQPSTPSFPLQRYSLKQYQNTPQPHTLQQIQQQIVYNMQAPASVFQVSKVITIQHYQLLQIKQVTIVLINPTTNLLICIEQIWTDSHSVKRIKQKHTLPFCIQPSHKYPFYFSMYITEHKPVIFKSAVYFLVSIRHKQTKSVIDQKIWPREIVAKVVNNYLKLMPIEVGNCHQEGEQTSFTIPNTQGVQIQVGFANMPLTLQQNKSKNGESSQSSQVVIPAYRNFKMTIPSKQSLIQITTKVQNNNNINMPSLLLPINCIQPLYLNNFQIGTMNSQREQYQMMVPISSSSKQIIQLHQISMNSSSQTVQLKQIALVKVERLLPGSQHIGVCMLVFHVPNRHSSNVNTNNEVTIQMSVKYSVFGSNQIKQARNQYKYNQIRNPFSVGTRRFIDVTKMHLYSTATNNLNSNKINLVLHHIFHLRNNLNLPLNLLTVIYEPMTFKLTYLNDRKQFIYPNQVRDQFALQYIGTNQLPYSPYKHAVTLSLNGFVIVPIQIVLYDHTLQCEYKEFRDRCKQLHEIDFGYFRNAGQEGTKVRRIMLRNWNPVQKYVYLGKVKGITEKGMLANITLLIQSKYEQQNNNQSENSEQIMHYDEQNNQKMYLLKPNSQYILNIQLSAFPNATSGESLLNLHTEQQSFTFRLKYKVQNGTIALIPQILRISSAYQHTVQYLNLVSTYSQPYKLKSTSVNISNINIFYNNHSQIYQNQWIGLALVYEPFQIGQVVNGAGTVLGTSFNSNNNQQNTVTNITQICCGNQFFMSNFINVLLNGEPPRFTYITVKVQTTTQLQANSTIIIDNTASKLINQHNLSISLISLNVQQKEKQRETSKYTIYFNNFFKDVMKYRPMIVPKALYEDTRHYMSASRKARKSYEDDTMLCLNEETIQKHKFSGQMLKGIFGVTEVQEIGVKQFQRIGGDYYYYWHNGLNKNRKNLNLNTKGQKVNNYVKRQIQNGARTCYKINATKYIKQLIQSKIINEIAQNYPNQVFLLFVQKQMQFYNTPLHYLQYDQFYDSLLQNYNFDKICKKSVYPLFRFCRQIGVTLLPVTDQLLEPGEQGKITIKSLSKTKENYQEFYMVILNNITKYEVHFVQVSITEPKIQINKVFQNGKQFSLKNYMTNNFKYEDNVQLKNLTNLMPILLKQQDIKQQKYQTARNFSLKNTGNIDIKITHIGFSGYQKLCEYRGIKIYEQFCNGFILPSQSEIIFSLYVYSGLNSQIKQTQVYLYSDNSFYFKINIIVKGTAPQVQPQLSKYVFSFLINLISFLLLLVVIMMFKKQIDEKEKVKKQVKKSKIMNPSNYVNLGSRIQTKVRKLEPIPQQLLAAAKQIQQSKIKQFFNSSDESDIAKKAHTEQQQNSNIQILNALKTDKGNISVSEESSIDFIDLNALNRSSNNMSEQVLQSNSKTQSGGEQSFSEGSEADSNWNDGDEIDPKTVRTSYGWGDQGSQRKKQEDSNSYYNVFFSQNPLKKSDKNQPFHWMKGAHK